MSFEVVIWPNKSTIGLQTTELKGPSKKVNHTLQSDLNSVSMRMWWCCLSWQTLFVIWLAAYSGLPVLSKPGNSILVLNLEYILLVNVLPGNTARPKKFRKPQSVCNSFTVAFFLFIKVCRRSTALWCLSTGILRQKFLPSSKIPKKTIDADGDAHSVFSIENL